MKINWGTSIVIVIVMFISFIMYMVITMMSAHTDIVEKDYYAQQIDYQATKEAKENGLEIVDLVLFDQTEHSVNIVFPEQSDLTKITSGNIHFYRTENASLDRKFEMNSEAGNIQAIPLEFLEGGNYSVKIRWTDEKKDYYIERGITIK